MKLKNKILTNIAIGLIIFGSFTIIYFIFAHPFNNPNSLLFSQFGDFIGGFVGSLFSLAGFLLIYETFKLQKIAIDKQTEAIAQQKDISDIDRFENLFFNLLKNYQEVKKEIIAWFNDINTSEIKYNYEVKGLEFFIGSKNELKFLIKIFRERRYISYDKLIEQNNDEDDQSDNNGLYSKEEQIEELRMGLKIDFYKISPEDYNRIKQLEVRIQIVEISKLFFKKNNYAIANYFNFLFMIVDFVENSKIKKEENTKYIGFIITQMTKFELFLLYYYLIANNELFESKQYISFLFENLYEEDLLEKEHNNLINSISLNKRDL
ncbi:MAG: hypothetical protein A2033_02345 [Bacteroidetes bacterium GWA2_31_9]|nr:MAG: hypothetical protein A2033_02345 [Bacteroidetes bacterium GWA2_31_9]